MKRSCTSHNYHFNLCFYFLFFFSFRKRQQSYIPMGHSKLHFSPGGIAGVVVGAVALLISLAIIIFIINKYKWAPPMSVSPGPRRSTSGDLTVVYTQGEGTVARPANSSKQAFTDLKIVKSRDSDSWPLFLITTSEFKFPTCLIAVCFLWEEWWFSHSEKIVNNCKCTSILVIGLGKHGHKYSWKTSVPVFLTHVLILACLWKDITVCEPLLVSMSSNQVI